MTTQELSGDDVLCGVCQNIFDCRNHEGVWFLTGDWICGNCCDNHTDEELLARFKEED
mgnify:FL=1